MTLVKGGKKAIIIIILKIREIHVSYLVTRSNW